MTSHWRLVLRYGDEPALAYRAKGVLHRLHGEWVESVDAFIASGRRAKDQIERLSFQAGAVDGLGRAGQVDRAVRLGRRLSKGLDRLGESAAAARIRLNTGNALLWSDRYREARVWLERAAPELDAGGFAVEAAAALLGLSTAHLFGGDPALASEHAKAALAEFQALGLDHYAALTNINLAQASTLSGRSDDAISILLPLREPLQDEPFERARAEEFLGNAYLALGMLSEAADCYRQALVRQKRYKPNLNRANCLFGLGRAAYEEGDPATALRKLRRARTEYQRFGNPVWAAAAHAFAARCLLEQGAGRRALTQAEQAVRELRRFRSRYWLAEALLALSEAQIRTESDVGKTLAECRRIVAANGFLALLWRVYYLRAKLGGPGAARSYAEMVEAILQSRLLVSSSVSRSSYLRDKADALAEYLSFLLERPTKKRVRRAVDVVRKTRSIALADEILSSGATSLSEVERKDLDALREELNRIGVESNPGQERRAAIASRPLDSLQRRWIEASRRTIEAVSPILPSSDTPATVLIETQEAYFAVKDGRSIRLDLTPRDLKERLKWLQFDLLAPMAYPEDSPKNSVAQLKMLRAALADPWFEGEPLLPISPDSALWLVPWQAVLNADTCSTEPALLPSVGFGSHLGEARLPDNAKVAICSAPSDLLPNVEAETEALLKHFKKARIARNISEVRAIFDEKEWDLLHVAGHASFNPENPMFSYMSFEGGALYAAEIATSSLRAKHVVLSACDTGCLSLVKKTEPDGLARAFLARGAQTVLACSWPLDDRTAKDVMDSYYAELRRGETVAGSLSHARSVCRDSRPHPYYWGCWVLFGGYAT